LESDGECERLGAGVEAPAGIGGTTRSTCTDVQLGWSGCADSTPPLASIGTCLDELNSHRRGQSSPEVLVEI